jgi:hypothetical protein
MHHLVLERYSFYLKVANPNWVEQNLKHKKTPLEYKSNGVSISMIALIFWFN